MLSCWKKFQKCNFLDSMVQQGFLPDVVSYSASIRGLIKIQEVDRALKLFTDLCSRGHRPDERALQGQQSQRSRKFAGRDCSEGSLSLSCDLQSAYR